MNYLIWKGKDSRSIKGLIISELPPISKPLMRVAETVVDGVDGSIIEELGYSTYDKALVIGLTPNANIDEITQYFTGSGEVVFSNEADKYYKASIIGQIDFARLVRFRTATVVFRVQPFKYEYLENAVKVDAKSISGATISINKGKISQLSIEGRSTQAGTPTPEAPIEIESVGGNNLCSTKEFSSGSNTRIVSDKESNEEVEGILVKAGTYTASFEVTQLPREDYRVQFVASNDATQIQSTAYLTNRITVETATCNALGKYSISITVTETCYLYLRCVVYGIVLSNIQILKGTLAQSYIPYGKYGVEISNGANKTAIVLDEPLRSLPNGAKDSLNIANSSIYVERNTAVIVFDGSEDWKMDYGEGMFSLTNCFSRIVGNTSALSNSFKFNPVQSALYSRLNEGEFAIQTNWNETGNNIFFKKLSIKTVDEWKDWLSANNIIVIYETIEENIEPIDTIFTLNNGEFSNSENANMVLSYIDESVNVINLGNHTAKPVITLKGNGTVELIVNNERLLRYNFPQGEDTVVIDSEKQDAYLGAILKNRNMVGEFPVLEIGENTITWDGAIESIKISSKSRWL